MAELGDDGKIAPPFPGVPTTPGAPKAPEGTLPAPSTVLKHLNPKDRQGMIQHMAQLSVDQMLRTQNDMVDTCFSACVNEFHGAKGLDHEQAKCFDACADKVSAFYRRADTRFSQWNKGVDMTEELVEVGLAPAPKTVSEQFRELYDLIQLQRSQGK